jgi:hypothetical protein
VSTNQLFFAIGGLMVTLFGIFMAFVKYYIDAKVDPIAADVKLLVTYMIDHESRISRLEERTK